MKINIIVFSFITLISLIISSNAMEILKNDTDNDIFDFDHKENSEEVRSLLLKKYPIGSSINAFLLDISNYGKGYDCHKSQDRNNNQLVSRYYDGKNNLVCTKKEVNSLLSLSHSYMIILIDYNEETNVIKDINFKISEEQDLVVTPTGPSSGKKIN